MKTHSQKFKENISKLGRQLKSRITFENNGVQVELGNPDLNSITPSYETELLKSVMKYIEVDSNVNIPVGTIFKYELGLKTDSYIETTDTIYLVNKDYYIYSGGKYILLVAGTDYIVGDDIEETTYEFQEYEYINYGNYVVKEIETKEDTNSYLIKAYDKMLYSMKEYENIGIDYPITIRSYINALANHIGLSFANNEDEFVNYDKEIPNELFLNNQGESIGYTFRDVLDQLSEVTASNICINETDELELRYITDSEDTINESYLKNINVKFGKTFGPVNTITLTRAGGSDSIYNEDAESVAQNGRCEIKISENQIMNFNDRDTYIPEILEQLDGLEFSICDFDSTGICYYNVCDTYEVNIDQTTYNCLMLNDTTEITQGLQESIYVNEPEYTNTDYTKSDKTDNKINQTYIIANKQEGQIEALTSRVQTTEDELRNTYTIDQVNTLIQNAETGVTNTFSKAGGNNIFRNTGLWFENGDDENNPYEFWSGKVKRQSEERASNLNALLLQNNTLSQRQTVPNGNYTVSFKYKKLIALAEVKVAINDVEYELTEDEETEFIKNLSINSQQIKVDFISDTNDACLVYDVMVNAGSVKLAYSQNQNETTTDTVNISKGITITSSDTDTTFKANADGIRTLDNYGNKLAEFTDKGMSTKEIVVREKAQVVELLFQKIGDQIWISKL